VGKRKGAEMGFCWKKFKKCDMLTRTLQFWEIAVGDLFV